MQTLTIRNFHPIKNVEINIQRTLIFVGEQASGKSTVSQLIYFFKSFRGLTQEVLLKNLPKAKALALFSKTVKEQFKEAFTFNNRANSNAKFTFSKGNEITVKVTRKQNVTLKLSPVFKEKFEEAVYMWNIKAQQKLSPNAREFAMLDVLDDLFDNEDTELLYMPIERQLTVGHTALFHQKFYQYLNHMKITNWRLLERFYGRMREIRLQFKGQGFEEFLGYFLDIGRTRNQATLQEFINHTKTILKGRYKMIGSDEFIFSSTTEKESLNEVSSGQQAALRMLQYMFMTMLSEDKSCLTIEFPETYLSPKMQTLLVRNMVLMMGMTENELVIHTHSTHILKAFEGEMKRCDVGIFKIEKGKITNLR